MADEKTEKPTARKRKESRKEGQVPRTPELGAWMTILVVGMAMPFLVERELTVLGDLMARSLRTAADPSTGEALRLLHDGAVGAALALVLLGSGVMVIGVACALAQGGFFVATKAVKPTFAKLSLVKGAKRVFGVHGLWEGAKMLIKSGVVALFVYTSIRSLMPLIGGMFPMRTVLDALASNALQMLRNIAVAGLVMAAGDYAMQRRRMGKQTRMSKEDIRQENKQTEGDPMLKSAIRSRQLAASRNRMLADVPKADAVLVNPTHVAVALSYDPQSGAPRVVARGAGAVARRIREAAVGADVPLVRDVPLARALYTSTKVGQQIPAELFEAVAQVLAFVISRKARGQRGGEHASPRKEQAVPTVLPAGRRRAFSSAPQPPGR